MALVASGNSVAGPAKAYLPNHSEVFAKAIYYQFVVIT